MIRKAFQLRLIDLMNRQTTDRLIARKPGVKGQVESAKRNHPNWILLLYPQQTRLHNCFIIFFISE